jgi:hypothetical protein
MFEVTEKDLIGELTGFPIEVVRMMILKQVEQGNLPNVQRFQREPRAAVSGGGFDWDATDDGFEFWATVVGQRQWHVFFDKYPHGIEMPSFKKAKPLKVPRKLHFTKAQKWCLERMRLNTGPLHDRLRAILNENLRSTPHFDFPILPRDIDEALKLFGLERYELESLDNRISALRMRITETLTSIYYMNQAFMYDDVHGTIRIWDKNSKGVRSALNWAKKHYALLGSISHVRLGDGCSNNTSIDVVGKAIGIPSSYEYDKTLGAYRQEGSDYHYILGNILLHIN